MMKKIKFNAKNRALDISADHIQPK
jgi:hypothetical protein